MCTTFYYVLFRYLIKNLIIKVGVLMYSVFGERDNKIMHINYILPIENGLKCNCICPSCGAKLIARTLGKKNKKCFAHMGNSNCISGL